MFLLEPAAEQRIAQLIDDIVAHIRTLPGAGHSGDMSGLKDVFEEWADQLAFDQSVFFDEYERLAYWSCDKRVRELSYFEICVLAAFSEEFARYTSTDLFQEEASLDQFGEIEAVVTHLFGRLSRYAADYGVTKRDELEDLFGY